MKIIVIVLLLFALFALGHGSWHAPLVNLGNGITAFFTGAP